MNPMQRINRGLTLPETMVAAGAGVVMLAVGTTVIANRGGVSDSQYKLAELGQANECYANDWGGSQWSAMPADAGLHGDDCNYYRLANQCPALYLGRGQGGAVWAYFSGCSGQPGNCGNWVQYRPMNFTTDPTSRTVGSCRVMNVWGFREYVSHRFYAPEWFSEDDPNYAGASTQFEEAFEFNYPVAALDGGFANSSFCYSPAAMLHPGVLRARAEGGFQAPASFANSYRTPTVTQCVHPALKTRMLEYGWYRGAPQAGLAFNAGRKSSPYALYFDGSVQMASMASAEADDDIVRAASKTGDGLWSDDTPFGAEAWFDTDPVDGLRTGFHMLTTGGITGRDILTRE